MTIRIGVIGTGPAGLVAALALEKHSSPSRTTITLLDRNLDTVDYPGVEYGIQARANFTRERLGPRDAAAAMGHPGTGIVLHTMRTNSVQRRIPFDAANTFSVLRTDFLGILSNLLHRTEALRGHDAEDVAPLDDGRVRVSFGERGGATPCTRVRHPARLRRRGLLLDMPSWCGNGKRPSPVRASAPSLVVAGRGVGALISTAPCLRRLTRHPIHCSHRFVWWSRR
jgi:hypothetical protein